MVALGAECDLLRPLVAGRPFLEAEVLWAVRHELALSLDDVLARRTRLAQELPDRGAAIAPRVAQIMAGDLDWGEARQPPGGRDLPGRGAPRVLGAHPPVRPVRPTARSTTARLTRRRHRPVTGRRHGAGHGSGELQRAFFDAIYTYRIPVGLAAGVFAVGAALVAWRLGWFGAARRHPARAGILLVIGLAIALPLGYYVASPLWIRTELIEPEPVASRRRPRRRSRRPLEPTSRRRPSRRRPRSDVSASATPSTRPRSSRAVSPAASFHGTDDFHFGRGTATIIETAPGAYTLRLEAFSVRNGPDLFVYLSPSAHDYVKGAVEVGASQGDRWRLRVRRCRGYGPGRFRQRDHLVQAVLAPVRGGSAGGHLTLKKYAKVRYWQRFLKRVPSRP